MSRRQAPAGWSTGWTAVLLAPLAALTFLMAFATTPLLSATAHASGTWQLQQPPPPPGARFKVPLGTPDDMQFIAPNEGLLSVEGNAVVSPGLFFWDGQQWHELSTVCGGGGGASRIAWAGPEEFWTITQPSEPRVGAGLGLCHFKDGQVVGSYSTALQSPDPFRPMDAAACNGPDDCWFAGIGSQDPTGQRVGAFHLHWDGTNLTSSYQPQGRGVSGLAYFNGTFYESTFVGAQPGDSSDPVNLATPEPQGPVLIHKLAEGIFDDVNFLPFPYEGVPSEGTELLSAKSDGSDLWFAGGGAASGPDVSQSGSVPAPPVAVHYGEPFYQQVPLDTSAFGANDRFVDIAPVPGTSTAWVADQPFADQGSTTAKAKVALIGADGRSQITSLPTSGAGRGSAALIAFTTPGEGWMATSGGWLFHYTDGTVYPQDTDPAWAATITQRPNESVAQFISDTPPADDSQLFAPPPVQVTQTSATSPTAEVIPALLKDITVTRHKLTVTVRFDLTRLAQVELLAKRRKTVVAHTRDQRLKPGKHVLALRLNAKRWPTALHFTTKELTKPTPVPASGCTNTPGTSTDATSSGPGPNAVSTKCETETSAPTSPTPASSSGPGPNAVSTRVRHQHPHSDTASPAA
jgi:hypothetical protein